MKMTVKRLRLLEEIKDEFESKMDRLAQAYAFVSNQHRFGYMTGYSLGVDSIFVEYDHQGCDCTIRIPYRAVEDDDLEAAAIAAAEQNRIAAEYEKARQAELAKLARQRQYEALKKEFENAPTP